MLFRRSIDFDYSDRPSFITVAFCMCFSFEAQFCGALLFKNWLLFYRKFFKNVSFYVKYQRFYGSSDACLFVCGGRPYRCEFCYFCVFDGTLTSSWLAQDHYFLVVFSTYSGCRGQMYRHFPPCLGKAFPSGCVMCMCYAKRG